MVKNLYIDGIDVRDAFGVWVRKGGYDDLFTFPPMKPPHFNDWPEQHGIEVDLKAPTLAPLSVRVLLIASGANANVAGFIELLSKPGYRVCRFPTLDREFKLRYVECGDFEQVGNVSVFAVQFELDEPKRVDPATWLAPGVPVRTSPISACSCVWEKAVCCVPLRQSRILRAISPCWMAGYTTPEKHIAMQKK